MGVLGGFKNMLRTWRNNLRRKKKKEEIEVSINKKKKRVSIFYSLLAIIISPFGMFFSNVKKSNIKNIEKRIENCTKTEEIEDVKLEFNKIKKNINKKKQEFVELKINNKIEQIKHEEAINKSIDKTLEKTNFNIDTKNVKTKENFSVEKNNVKTNGNIEKLKVNKKEKTNDISIVSNNSLEQNDYNKSIVLSSVETIDKEGVVTVFNEKIKKEFNKKIEEIEEDIKELKKYNESYPISYKIKEFKDKIDILKKEYDKNNLIFDDNLSFDDVEKLEIRIVELEKKLESKKKEFLISKSENEIEKKTKDDKKEIKDEKRQNNEFEHCSRIVIENIEKCNRYYNNYLKEIKKNNKKNILFKYINILSGSVLNVMLGIFPFRFIKNIILRNYIIALNTNNTIRTMNKMLNPLNLNNQYLLLNECKDLSEVLQNTYSILNDSLERILVIKEELVSLGVNDIDKELYNKILNMENLIKQNIKQMDEKHNKLNKVYIKIKNDF